jgi:membrane-bound serine protease (ClpP class)
MNKILIILGLIASFAIFSPLAAQDSSATAPTKIYVFEIFEEIAKPAVRNTQNAIKEAKELEADIIILHLNTYGGAVDAADSIRTALLNCPIPVWVYIDNNAASAGALISIACDSIYMRKGANIGAATVVNQNAEAMPDKYQSYMRSMMRSTAEAQGRNPDIAEAMVDQDVYVEGISDSGKVLTFTTSEAIENGYCEGQAESIEEIIKMNGIVDYEIVEYELSAMDKIINFLISPAISGILIILIIGGIYFELQTPGVGFPLALAILAAILYFAPLFLEGMADNWEILIFVLGVALIALEVFVIPGFGVPGVLGIILVISGLAFAMVKNDGFDMPDNDFSPLVKAFGIVLGSIFIGLMASFYFGEKLLTSKTFGSKIALHDEFKSDKGYIASDNKYKEFIGRTGVTITVFRPAGKIEIDGDQYDASVKIGLLDAGEEVVVVGYEGMQLIVKKK